jgi:hypothetical protein
MEAAVINITLVPGGSWRHRFTLNEPGPTPIDLTGFEARAEVRDKPGGATLYISVNEVPSADGYIILGGAAGTVDVFISADATMSLKNARGASWDLFLENPNAEDVDQAVRGKVTIGPAVTDPTYD